MPEEKHVVGPHGAFAVTEVIDECAVPDSGASFQNRLWRIKGAVGSGVDAEVVMTGMELLDLARLTLTLNSASWYAKD